MLSRHNRKVPLTLKACLPLSLVPCPFLCALWPVSLSLCLKIAANRARESYVKCHKIEPKISTFLLLLLLLLNVFWGQLSASRSREPGQQLGHNLIAKSCVTPIRVNIYRLLAYEYVCWLFASAASLAAFKPISIITYLYAG